MGRTTAEYNRRWRAANPDKVAAWKPRARTQTRERRRARRSELLAVYGGACACCGETIYAFLTFDHKDGIPPEHRGANGKRYCRIVELLWQEWQETGRIRDDIEVMCFNCNSGRAVNGGVCPHKEVVS
jgi:hypothetical protein